MSMVHKPRWSAELHMELKLISHLDAILRDTDLVHSKKILTELILMLRTATLWENEPWVLVESLKLKMYFPQLLWIVLANRPEPLSLKELSKLKRLFHPHVATTQARVQFLIPLADSYDCHFISRPQREDQVPTGACSTVQCGSLPADRHGSWECSLMHHKLTVPWQSQFPGFPLWPWNSDPKGTLSNHLK